MSQKRVCDDSFSTEISSSGGSCGRECGKADTPQQVVETWIVPQAVHARIYMKIDQPVGVLFVGLLQVFNCAVIFSQANVDSGEKVGCDIFLLGQFCQIIEHLE